MSNDEPLFDSDVDPKRIKNVADGLRRQGEFESARMLDSYAVMLAAAPQQAAEPVAVTDEMVERACKKYAFREDGATFPDAYSEEEVLAERVLMREFLEHVLRTAQPAQDAKLPNAEDFRLHLGELSANELRIARAAFRFAMAKESGR